jgi:hypothetical protein
MKTHRFTVRGKLLSINGERKLHHQRRAEWVREWRTDAGWEIKAARIPHLDRVSVIASPYQHKDALGDAGNHLPSVKAVVDALVDVGVLDGDGPQHVSALTLIAPCRIEGSGPDYVTFELIEGEG